MVSRVKIATTACVLASGLFVAGAGGAVAFADPESGAASDTGSTPPDNPAQHPLRQLIRTLLGQNAAAQPGVTAAIPGSSGTGTATDLPPVSVVGDGRGGMPRTTPSDSGSETDSKQPSETAPQDGEQGTAGSGEQSAAKPDAKPGGSSTSTESQTGTQAAAAAAAAAAEQVKAAAPTTSATEHTTAVAEITPAPTPAPTTLFSSPFFSLTLPSPGTPSGAPLVGGAAVPGQVQLSLAPLLIGAASQLAAIPQYLQLPDELMAPIQQLTDVVTGLATAASQLPFAQLTLTINLNPTLGSSVASGNRGSTFGRERSTTLPKTPPSQFVPAVTGGGATVPPAPPAPAFVPPKPPAVSADVEELTNSYRMGYTEYLRAAGTWKVAAVALPGITGMMAMVGAGGLLGYRQARAAQTVRSSGTARFAR